MPRAREKNYRRRRASLCVVLLERVKRVSPHGGDVACFLHAKRLCLWFIDFIASVLFITNDIATRERSHELVNPDEGSLHGFFSGIDSIAIPATRTQAQMVIVIK